MFKIAIDAPDPEEFHKKYLTFKILASQFENVSKPFKVQELVKNIINDQRYKVHELLMVIKKTENISDEGEERFIVSYIRWHLMKGNLIAFNSDGSDSVTAKTWISIAPEALNSYLGLEPNHQSDQLPENLKPKFSEN